jgi:hypothetical protein
MNLDHFTTQMANNAASIRSLVQGVADEQARWKPDPDSWSILEVINHLYDEEREDFRLRLDCILHQPDRPWPAIDPQGWVSQRRYNDRDLEQSLSNFLCERETSRTWLNGLPAPNWQAAYEAPFGRITAGDMFAAWVAHDLLHLRQLVELHWAYTVRAVQPYGVRYAGEW